MALSSILCGPCTITEGGCFNTVIARTLASGNQITGIAFKQLASAATCLSGSRGRCLPSSVLIDGRLKALLGFPHSGFNVGISR